MTTIPTTTRPIDLPDPFDPNYRHTHAPPDDHPALADPEGLALVQAIHDRKNATKAGPPSAMAETGRRGSESPDRPVSCGDGGS